MTVDPFAARIHDALTPARRSTPRGSHWTKISTALGRINGAASWVALTFSLTLVGSLAGLGAWDLFAGRLTW